MDPSKVVVLNPGSSMLYYGLMNQSEPFEIANIIAYRRKTAANQSAIPKRPASEPKSEEKVKGYSEALAEMNGFFKKKWSRELAPRETVDDIIDIDLTTIKSQEPIVGNDVYRIPQPELYSVVLPMRRGVINDGNHSHPIFHSDTLLSLPKSSMMECQRRIISYAIKRDLSINEEDVKEYSAVIIVPDVFSWKDIKLFVNMLLVSMHFKAVFVTISSLSTAFGAGITQCCIVDIGDQKTSICCIEDAIPYMYSKIHLPYGIADAVAFLEQSQPQSQGASSSSRSALSISDYIMRREVIEKYGDLSRSPVSSTGIVQFYVKNANQKIVKTEKYVVNELQMRVPMILFYNELGFVSKDLEDIDGASDPEDACDDLLLAETTTGAASTNVANVTNAANATTGSQLTSEVVQAAPRKSRKRTGDFLPEHKIESKKQGDGTAKEKKKLVIDRDDLVEITEREPYICGKIMPLDMAIVQSIRGITRTEARRALFRNIMLVGCGAKIPGIYEMLAQRIHDSYLLPTDAERVEVIPPPRSYDSRYLCWKGGCVISGMELASDAWISASDWKVSGLRILREKSMFLL